MAEQNWGIVPCDVAMDVSPANGFTKLELNSTQKIQVGALLQQLPSVAVTNKMSRRIGFAKPGGPCPSFGHGMLYRHVNRIQPILSQEDQ